jgi:hypothetical protein
MATETPEVPKKKRAKKLIARKSGDIDDVHLCEKSRVWHALLLDHLPDFTLLDAEFDLAFANSWLEKIEGLEAFPSDHNMRADMEGAQAEVKAKTKVLRKAVNELEYYADRAFAEVDNGRVMEEFGFERLRKMLGLGEGRWMVPAYTTYKIGQDFNAELTTAGMPVAVPEAMDEAMSELANAEINQEYTKRIRIRATTQRIKLFNHLFDIHTGVKKAAAIVFREKPIVAKQFE